MATERLLSLPSITAIKRLLGGFRDGEHFIGIRIDTHGKLHDFFAEANIEVVDAPSIEKKLRATLDHLNTHPAEHPALKRLINQVADSRYYRGDEHEASIAHLNQALHGDGFEVRCVGEKFRLHSMGLNPVAAEELTAKTHALDMASVRDDFERALSEADRDPADAITAACSTVESVCKCILDEMRRPYPASKDIKGLVSEVAKHLNLSPGRDDLPKEWEQDIRQILGGLFSVVGGIGALRTHAGDAHGRGKKTVPVDARIARLAIHSASTVSLFYIETWQRTHPTKL